MSFVHCGYRRFLGVLLSVLTLLVVYSISPARAQVSSAPLVVSESLLDQVATSTIFPNDPRWSQQWYLRQIGAPAAWAVSTGTRQVVVAVIDGGVDIQHPDLRENVWRNLGEIADDGIDNDQNGYIDDVHGWNFVQDSSDVRPVFRLRQLEDAWSHGTMVASLIAARGNDGIGMAGVAWNVRIMPLVVLDADGSGITRNLVSAIRYAVNQGAQVINLSVVGYDRDQALEEMMARAANAGVTIVAATGNDDRSKRGINIDEIPAYPACSDLGADAVIGVGGTDVLDQHAPFTNFGKQCTDLSAPAHALLVARPSYPHNPGVHPQNVPRYRDDVTGTSLAAPLVSGAVALLKSAHPSWTPSQIRRQLYETADRLDAAMSAGTKGVFGYGRLNIGRALTSPPPPVFVAGSVTSEPLVPYIFTSSSTPTQVPLKKTPSKSSSFKLRSGSVARSTF